MQEKVYTAFKRQYFYLYPSEIERDIEIVEKLITEIPKPHILGPVWPDYIAFNTEGHGMYLSNDLISWLAYEWHRSDTDRIRDRLLEISIEDAEWVNENNKEYNTKYYRKITFNKKAQAAAIDCLKTIVNDLRALLSKWMEEESEKS